MSDGAWVCLFSGGKDSSYALYRALQRGLPIERLVTVHPAGDSYMYHVPATEVATLAGESIDVPVLDVRPGDLGAPGADDAGVQGDDEIEPLEAALREWARPRGGIAGLTVGAVESDYQASRVESMADRLGADVFAPLWGREPSTLAAEMIDTGFEIVIVSVAASGLDESWLGRTLDAAALADLEGLASEYGVHVLGEGGEFETLVTDGPHMTRPIELEYETEWDGTRGRLIVQDADLR